MPKYFLRVQLYLSVSRKHHRNLTWCYTSCFTYFILYYICLIFRTFNPLLEYLWQKFFFYILTDLDGLNINFLQFSEKEWKLFFCIFILNTNKKYCWYCRKWVWIMTSEVKIVVPKLLVVAYSWTSKAYNQLKQ